MLGMGSRELFAGQALAQLGIRHATLAQRDDVLGVVACL